MDKQLEEYASPIEQSKREDIDELTRRHLDALTEAVTSLLRIVRSNPTIPWLDQMTIDHVTEELEAIGRERRQQETGEPAGS